ncbi:MAG TPA: hypothetical protein VNO81_05265 [Candidatus Nitrosotenuis sp.]|jgi:hypothetical protein|nr:hypothetical protein [Candidatus Nitrosotenuis sp.]
MRDALAKDLRKKLTDLSNTVGQKVWLYVRSPSLFEGLQPGHGLGLKGNVAEGRLVGSDRHGLWFEPAESLEKAGGDPARVLHYFVPWTEVLTLATSAEKDEQVQTLGLRRS